MISRAAHNVVKVRSPEASRLQGLLRGPDVWVTEEPGDVLHVEGLTSEQIGRLAADNGIALFELTPLLGSLEEALMELTRDAVEFHTPAIASASVLSTTGSGES